MAGSVMQMGAAALAGALERLRRNAATAALATSLVPLAAAAIPTGAQASTIAPQASVTGSVVLGSVTSTYNYIATELSLGVLTTVYVPELHQGDLFGFTGAGYSAVEQSSTAAGSFAGQALTLKDGTVAPWQWVVTLGAGVIASGAAASFSFLSDFSTSVNANFGLTTVGNNAGNYLFDPPIPNDPLPEPVTLGVLATGLAGLAAARRRRRL